MANDYQESDDLRVVPASVILAKIKNGATVEYDHKRIVGNLDISYIDIPKRDTEEHDKIRIRGSIKITNSEIEGSIIIKNAVFESEVSFSGSRFVRDVDFEYSCFCRGANFERAQFSGNANFFYSGFAKDAEFKESKFNKNARFAGARFEYADFLNSEFSGLANFDGSKFCGNALFERARFHRLAYFGGRSEFHRDAVFRYSQFNEDAAFNESVFTGVAHFSFTNFNQGAFFKDAKFYNDAKFTGSTFRGFANFVSSSFGKRLKLDGAMIGNMTFIDAKFMEDAHISLKNAIFNKVEIPWKSIKGKLFDEDDSVYLTLVRNYNNQGWLEDADSCFFDYKTDNILIHFDAIITSLKDFKFVKYLINSKIIKSITYGYKKVYHSILYSLSLFFYGHGVKLILPFLVGVFILMLSAGIYHSGGQVHSFYPEGIRASTEIFIGISPEVCLTGPCKSWSIVERLLGSILMVTFLVVLAKKTLR